MARRWQKSFSLNNGEFRAQRDCASAPPATRTEEPQGEFVPNDSQRKDVVRHTDGRLRLLLVEDNPADARLLRELLREIPGLEFELTWHRKLSDCLGELDESDPGPDLVFLDLELPDSSGRETVRSIMETVSAAPVVVLTGLDTIDTAAEALAEGVQDYLVKGKVGPVDLVRAIETAIGRHRVERKLDDERAQLQQIIDEAPSFMALYMGPDLVLERANEAWFELVDQPDAVGLPADEIFSEPDNSTVLERLIRTYRSEESLYFAREDLKRETANGGAQETRHLRISYQPRVSEGETVGVLVHGVDVTDEVRARQRAEESREELAAILETAAEGIVFTDGDGVIRYANPAAEEIMGLPKTGITGRDYDDSRWQIASTDGGSFPREDLPIARALEERESVHDVEHTIERDDGTIVVLSVNAAPLNDDSASEREGAVASFRDVTERKKLELELRHRALHDPLTELPNRALFRDRLEQTINRARRSGSGFALLYLDLKRFKVVNDSLGHAAGDQVLTQIASRLRRAVRDQDTVARVGGDEFTVLLTELDGRDDAERGTNRIVTALEDPVDLGRSTVPVEAAIGVALCLTKETADRASVTELIRRADDAMYDVKDRPGTAFVLAGPSGSAEREGRMRRETELRRAISDHDVKPVYQPILSAETDEVIAVEALARWEHPQRGTLSPGTFIPLAEETGLITHLGERLLRDACRDVTALRDSLPPQATDALSLHVNLSARQLEDPDVADRVRDVMTNSEFPAARLVLEITESTAMRVPGSVRELNKLGVAISIDDFGTQYSSLTQVKRLPVNSLKIDRSFVTGLPKAMEDRAIVETVLTLGRTLNLKVIAEGVENEDQDRWLREAGCQYLQGYLFSRPVPADKLAGLLLK